MRKIDIKYNGHRITVITSIKGNIVSIRALDLKNVWGADAKAQLEKEIIKRQAVKLKAA